MRTVRFHPSCIEVPFEQLTRGDQVSFDDLPARAWRVLSDHPYPGIDNILTVDVEELRESEAV